MEPGQLESVPEIIECDDGSRSGSWPNISGAKLPGTVDGKMYRYTFNNLWNNKVTFDLELIGRELEYLRSFSIAKITMKI
jgi:hypothetical protein